MRQWSEDTRAELVAMYGRDAAERLLEKTVQWAQRQPELWALLSRRGLGARKEIVVPLVEHLRSVDWK